MKYRITHVLATGFLTLAFLVGSTPVNTLGQSRPQRPEPTTGGGKKNARPKPLTEEEKRQAEEERKQAEMEKNAIIDDKVERVEVNEVNIDAVVINKKTGEIITGLKKSNFAVFENGVKQEISSLTTPDTPITVTLLVEYSRWTELFGRANGRGFEPGQYEVVRPVAQFLTRFIHPPDDYASVIAFDMRPTPITDFTNDPAQIQKTIEVLLRSSPAFRENNLWDTIKLALVGGRGDSVVLDHDENETAEYSGMVAVKAKRKAVILVASGINTFSKIGFSDARKIIQQAGIPIYVISTGNMFFRKYDQYIGALDGIDGSPGRLTFLQAKNAMNTIARDSGGRHWEMTFPSEVPDYLNSINALLRNQYVLSYELKEKKAPGTKTKIEVKVDVNGDGIYDDKTFEVQHRPYYVTPGEEDKKAKK